MKEIINSEEIKLEKGVRLPLIISKRKGVFKYPFDKLETGNSFSYKAKNNGSLKRLQAIVCASAVYYGKKTNKQFTVRICNDCIRCWRIK